MMTRLRASLARRVMWGVQSGCKVEQLVQGTSPERPFATLQRSSSIGGSAPEAPPARPRAVAAPPRDSRRGAPCAPLTRPPRTCPAAPFVRIAELPAHAGESVTVRAWVTHVRSSGKIAFAVLRDGTGICQAVFVEEPGAAERCGSASRS